MFSETPMTRDMLPGQYNSNMLKLVASSGSVVPVRGLHSRPVTCSITATPVLISNSFLLKFFVDKAMYNRMLVFNLETDFTTVNKNINVEIGERMIAAWMKVCHARHIMRLYPELSSSVLMNDCVNDWICVSGRKDVTDPEQIITLFSTVFLKHVKTKKVLKLSENSNVVKLNESANSFLHAYGSLLLASRPSPVVVQNGRQSLPRCSPRLVDFRSSPVVIQNRRQSMTRSNSCSPSSPKVAASSPLERVIIYSVGQAVSLINVFLNIAHFLQKTDVDNTLDALKSEIEKVRLPYLDLAQIRNILEKTDMSVLTNDPHGFLNTVT